MILSKLKIHNCVFAGNRPPVESKRWKGRETFYGSPSSITPLRNPLLITTSEKPLVKPTLGEASRQSHLWNASRQSHLWEAYCQSYLGKVSHLSSGASRWMPIVKGPVQVVQPLQKVILVKVISSKRGTNRKHQLAKEASLKVLERGCLWGRVDGESVTTCICQIHDQTMRQSSHIGKTPGSKVSQNM